MEHYIYRDSGTENIQYSIAGGVSSIYIDLFAHSLVSHRCWLRKTGGEACSGVSACYGL